MFCMCVINTRLEKFSARVPYAIILSKWAMPWSFPVSTHIERSNLRYFLPYLLFKPSWYQIVAQISQKLFLLD